MTEMRRSMAPSGGSTLAEAPHIVAIEPSRGPQTGGFQVTITGRGFSNPCQVYFGDAEADYDRKGSNDHVIKCTAPAHAPGDVDVFVKNKDGKTSNKTRIKFT